MTVLAYETEIIAWPNMVAASYCFFDTAAVDTVLLFDHRSDDLSTWPPPSHRPTTSASALALEERTTPDPEPRLPELEIRDGLGL